jgi:ABC-type glutathione transport system ATPase component
LQAGTLAAPRPTVGRLADGSHWLYAARTNGLAGESGCGKTWTALRAVATELEDGHPVVFVDLEDNEIGVAGRLLAMRVDPRLIADRRRFAYIYPDEPIQHGWDLLHAHRRPCSRHSSCSIRRVSRWPCADTTSWAPTKLMAETSDLMGKQPSPLSTDRVRAAVCAGRRA